MGTYNVGQEVEMVETFRVSGVPTDPTTITFSLRDPSGTVTTYVFGVDPEVTHTAVGTYVLTITPLDAGDYVYWVVGTGLVEATSSPGTFRVFDPSNVGLDPGPCTPWLDGQDVAECCADAAAAVGSNFAELDPIAKEASDLLFDLSGRQFAGMCEKTVRPCSNRWCGFQVLSRGHLVGPWDTDTFYSGWGWNGSYWNFGSRSCGCSPLSQVKLSGFPVRSIVQVKIDGVVVPEANNWRLDEKRWLTRIADVNGNAQAWPSCQRLDLPDTAPGTFSVTYRYGLDPPLSAVRAAEALACELWKACTGQECALPTGTTRVTRQGITISRTAFQRDTRTGIWATGMPMVDAFLASVNPSGLRRRPSVWAPGGQRYARRFG